MYERDGEHSQSAAASKFAAHELHVAEALGNPAKCLNQHDFIDYVSVQVHNTLLNVSDLRPQAILSIDASQQSLLRGLNQEDRAANPFAYNAIKRDVALFHSLVPQAKREAAVEASNAAEAARGEQVAEALSLCRDLKRSASAFVERLFVKDIQDWSASADIDEDGKASNIRVTIERQPVAASPNEDVLIAKIANTKFQPAVTYNPVERDLQAASSSVLIRNGVIVSHSKPTVATFTSRHGKHSINILRGAKEQRLNRLIL